MELEDSRKEYNVLATKTDFLPAVFLINPGKDTTASKGVRDLVNSKESAKITKAQAIVVDNLAHRIMANFVMKFNNSGIVIKVFSDEAIATEWLYQFIDDKE